MTGEYFKLLGADGSVSGIFRVRREAGGSFDEWYDPSALAWVQDDWGYVARFLRGDCDGVPISHADAEALLHQLIERSKMEPVEPKRSRQGQNSARSAEDRRR